MPQHIVDTLIEERAGRLKSNPIVWSALRPALYALLKYRAAVRMAEQIRSLEAREVLEKVRAMLQLKVQVAGIENIPKTGRFILAPNHPTLADFVPVYDVLRTVRPDFTLLANRDAIRVSEKLNELLIPVEVTGASNDRETSRQILRLIIDALHKERALVIFPSGGIARLKKGELHEQPWLPTPLNLARKYQVPIVPLHIDGRNSRLYYFFGKLCNELRDMTVFYEVLNKYRCTYRLTFGPVISHETIPHETRNAVSRLQNYVENILPGYANGPLRMPIPAPF